MSQLASNSNNEYGLVPKKVTRLEAIVRYLAGTLILLGILFRLHQYLANRSLWLDEAMLALNIIHRSLSGLVEQLGYHQGAPFGFLFIEKLSILALGNTEYVLRLFPLISGIASIFLFYYLAKNILSDLGILLSLALFVVSNWLIYYASEVKQYSSDVAIVLLLFTISFPLFQSKRISLKHYIYWGVIGGISLWFSHPAIFILLSITTGLLIQYLTNKAWSQIKWFASGIGIWIAIFLLVYWIALRVLVDDQILVEFWRNYYMPAPPWSDLSWFRLAGCDFLMSPVGLSGCKLGAVLLFLGAFSLLFRKTSLGIALLLSFLITLSASAMHYYPFGNRLILFLVPLAFILISEGVDLIRRITLFRRWVSFGIWMLLAIFLLIWPARQAFSHLTKPRESENIKPVMAYVQSNRTPGDQICTDSGAEPAYRYYAHFYRLTEEPCVLHMPSSETHEAYTQEIGNKTQPGRVWFLFSHKNDREDVNNEEFFLETVDHMGRTIDQHHSSGASVYLADIKK